MTEIESKDNYGAGYCPPPLLISNQDVPRTGASAPLVPGQVIFTALLEAGRQSIAAILSFCFMGVNTQPLHHNAVTN